MPQRDLVVIGASAGGLEALRTIVKGLTADLRACVLVVTHSHSENIGVLPQILARSSAMPVSLVEDGAPIVLGRIYVAMPDCHLLVFPGVLRLTHGPRENGFRPAVDPLFRTAARAYGPRVIGVILSGALDDGTFGLGVVKEEGGLAVVQDPGEAIVPSMPASAIRNVAVDHVLPASDIADLLMRICGEPARGESAMSRPGGKEEDAEAQLPEEAVDVEEMEAMHGAPSGLTCPDCGGALWEIDEGRLTRYKCHVGHQYSPDSLVAEQADAVEGALWTAVRALEERAELRTRMAKRAEAGGLPDVSEAFSDRARNSHEQAQLIRRVLFRREGQKDHRRVKTDHHTVASDTSARPPKTSRKRARRR